MAEGTLRVGNVEITNVRDLPWMLGAPAYMYPDVPAEAWEPHQQWLDHKGRLNMTLGSMLIRSAGKTILMDTGIGQRGREGFATGRANLVNNLGELGVRPEDVDIVVISHVHVDHVGWNTIDRDGKIVTTFPNAEYWIRQREWDFFTTHPEWKERDYIVECVLPLAQTSQLRLIGDDRPLTDEVQYLPAPGHTPDHSGIAILSGGERAFLIGDGAHHPVQVTETEWKFVLDIDQDQACRSRAAFVRKAHAESAIVAGAHFPYPGWGRVSEQSGRHYWTALPEDGGA